VSSVIIGAKKLEQLADNLKTTDWEMTDEEVKELDKLSEPTSVYPYWMQKANSRDRV